MKNINIRKWGILLFLPFLLFSCEKWIDTEMNIDPNKPSDVPMEYLLPSIQASMAYSVGGNTAVRATNIWMQFFDGVDRQSLAQGRYNITSADVNDLWETLYAQAMMDCKTLIDKADVKNSPHYAGVAKVCFATCLGTLTDLYGDLPYSEAFLGSEGNLQPAYESQETIYGIISTMLDEAIADLSSQDNAVPLASDLIYNGDVNLWVKAAYALKARFTLNLSKKNDAAYTEALGYVALSFSSNSDDYEMAYEGTTSGSNPLFQFMRDRTDIRMSSTFVGTLTDVNDPRLLSYVAVDLAGGYSGSDLGSENSAASHLGDYSASATAPTYFSSFAEMKFIEAECNFKLGQIDNAVSSYHQAIEASLMKVTGIADSTFMADHVYIDSSATVNLQKIIEQKYIAMFATVVPYDDWRRTGFPELAPVAGATKATPVRFPYPQSEITYNANCPVGVQLDDKLWIFE